MSTGAVASFSAPSPAARLRGKTSSVVLLMAGYDLMLATLIIVAGSQGTNLFVPPLVLWVAIYAMIALKFVTNLRPLLAVLRDNFAILAYPAIVFLSATWSLDPFHSLYSGTQLAMTYLAAFWIGWRYRPKEIALIMVLALTPVIVLSLINWWTGMFGEVFSFTGGLLGVFGNKNTFARMSMLLGLAALGLLVRGRNSPLHSGVLLSVLAMSAFALVLSKSATSTIVMFGATGLFVALTIRNYRTGYRLLIMVLGVLAVLAACSFLALSNIDPADEILKLFGKNSTLTGRTALWDLAIQQIADQPWLGVGFDAYWDSNAFYAADQIQRTYGDGAISFHNFLLDIWVGLGVPGVIAIGVTLSAITTAFVRNYFVIRDVDSAMMLAIMAAGFGVAMFSPLLYDQHGNLIILLVAFAVSARIEMRRSNVSNS